jgi:hypothetical protein
MNRLSALFTLMIPAAPNPCSIRAMISVGSEDDMAQAKEATVNRISPAW